MTNENYLQKRIMGRVYAFWLLRRIFSGASLKVVGLVVALGSLSAYVSFYHVILNASSVRNFDSQLDFWTTAFSSAEYYTLISLGLILVFAGWLALDTWRVKRQRVSLGFSWLARP